MKEFEAIDAGGSLKSGDAVISEQLEPAGQVCRLEYIICCLDGSVRRHAVLLRGDGTPYSVGLMGKGFKVLLRSADGEPLPPCFSTLQSPLPAVENYVETLKVAGARVAPDKNADTSTRRPYKSAKRDSLPVARATAQPSRG